MTAHGRLLHSLLAALALAPTLAVAATTAAQDAGAPDAGTPDPSEMTISELEGGDPFGADDLGLGAADPLSRLADDDALLTTTEPSADEVVTPPVAVVRGAVLDAVSGVHEARHTIRVTLARGLAIVDEEIEFASTARHRAEVREHFALPSDAALVSLAVCNASGCRDGVLAERVTGGAYDDALVVHVERASELPVAHARLSAGELVLRAAPVVRGGTLTLRVRWVAAAAVHGGSLRWEVPARGHDERLADVEIEVRSSELVEPGLDDRPLDDGVQTRRGGGAILVTALAPRSGGTFLEASTFVCGSERHAVVRARAPRPEPRPLRVAIAIDASPSTTAGARGRIADAALVLAQLLPPGSEVLPIAFAARAELLSELAVPPEAIDARALRHAVDAELGSMTNLEALWATIRSQPSLPELVVIVGDGGVSPASGRDATLAAMRAAGVRLGSVNVADRVTSAGLAHAVDASGGVHLDVALEARALSEHDSSEALSARLRALVMDAAAPAISVRTRSGTTELGVLRAGEELGWTGTGTPTVTDGTRELRATELTGETAEALCAHAAGRATLVAVEPSDLRETAGACAADGTRRPRPSSSASSLFGGGLGRIALAHRRDCDLPETLATVRPPDSGLVAPSLLRQLRRRVIPAARGCFRDDRAGRLHYETRLVIHLVLSDREIVHRSVTDAASAELAACIESAVENLDLPSFDGTIVVHWPLRTAGEPSPPTAELATDVSAAIDRIGEGGSESGADAARPSTTSP